VQNIPEGAEILEITLADWPCLKWPFDGKVTLIGDAAHAMTMCTFLAFASFELPLLMKFSRSRRSSKSWHHGCSLST
jgi:hypothetical protein